MTTIVFSEALSSSPLPPSSSSTSYIKIYVIDKTKDSYYDDAWIELDNFISVLITVVPPWNFFSFFIFIYFSSSKYIAMTILDSCYWNIIQYNETIAKCNFYRQDSLISPIKDFTNGVFPLKRNILEEKKLLEF